MDHPTANDYNDEICGETYDHTIPHWDEQDGVSVGMCSTCGAEIIDDLIEEET